MSYKEAGKCTSGRALGAQYEKVNRDSISVQDEREQAKPWTSRLEVRREGAPEKVQAPIFVALPVTA